MSALLETGRFYGKTQKKIAAPDVVLTEIRHAFGRKLPQHTHESAYFSLLLNGSYSEQCTHRAAEYGPFTVGFHPPSLTHRDEVGPCGVAMFCVELRDAFLQKMRPYLNSPHFVPDLFGSEMTWLSLRLYRAFRDEFLFSLQMEELCADMLERAAGMAVVAENGHPAWLGRTLDLLHDSFHEQLTLEGIAQDVRIHPIHLSRVFRRRYGCTLGEYANRLRVQFACRKLAEGWHDLTDLAFSAGFADQSHFGRIFKSLTGQTPGKFRAFAYRNEQLAHVADVPPISSNGRNV